MPKKKKANSYVKSTKKRSKQELLELQEVEEGNAKRPRPRAGRTSFKVDSAKEDDEEWCDIHGDPMYDKDDKIDNAVTSYEAEKIRRMAIHYFFVTAYKCPSMEEWDGPNGYVKKITTNILLPTSARQNVKKTMRDIVCCIATNEPFTGERLFSKREPSLIPPGAFENELVADSIKIWVGFLGDYCSDQQTLQRTRQNTCGH